jgi:signal transduction histidine kinase
VLDVGNKAEPIFRSRLVVRAEPGPSFAKVDPQRITQALLNLLHNAASHAPAATRVELRLKKEPGWWRFEVDDNGRGLPEDSEEEYFEAFRKRSRSGGSGLGLAVVRGVAEAHGGSAGVDNRPGRGATFWIRVPQ